MGTLVQPIVQISDTDPDILDYLVKRTAGTVGHLVEGADVVIVGTAEETSIRSTRVASEHEAKLKPWLSGAAGQPALLYVQITPVRVERWLTGNAEAGQVEIAYVHPEIVVDGGQDVPPTIVAAERGVFFLREIDPDAPYAPYIPNPAYHLALGNPFVRTSAGGGGSNGRPARGEVTDVEQTIAAIQWFLDVRSRPRKARRQAFLDAVDDTNPRIAHHAVRSLSHSEELADVLQGKVRDADETLQTRLMLGLWIAGAHSAALDLFAKLCNRHGRTEWLAEWGISPILDNNDDPTGLLFGPDPTSEWGD